MEGGRKLITVTTNGVIDCDSWHLSEAQYWIKSLQLFEVGRMCLVSGGWLEGWVDDWIRDGGMDEDMGRQLD